ncbi:YdcF family protein [Waterburya agarophytonicola K14]|uniref:YdcF family protein n=1 Tax=Waterburya agarophytonicola KI4 TaxID=2874699 RepID=A0A964BM84_9CYAN|nr:YdcF family protein [Waterburya agarophytonicola]MCC0175734.1 YdcF family protein [Waterburya agarophytonicola KI4]
MKKKFVKISFFAFLGFVSIALVTWKPLAISYGKWLAAGEENPKGDLSVLLSGSNERLETLIDLYNQGNVKGIYYAGGIDEKVPVLEGYRDIFAKYNLPSDRLYCGDLVESTFDEAQTFQRKLKDIKQPVNKIILVSDRYHLRRGVWSFEKVLGKDIEVTAYSTPSSPEIDDPHWWKHEPARKQVISETKKMAFYKLYYGLLGKGDLITHGDVNKITKGKISKGVEDPCQIVLPQLNN